MYWLTPSMIDFGSLILIGYSTNQIRKNPSNTLMTLTISENTSQTIESQKNCSSCVLAIQLNQTKHNNEQTHKIHVIFLVITFFSLMGSVLWANQKGSLHMAADENPPNRSVRLNNYENWWFGNKDDWNREEMIRILARKDSIGITESWTSVAPTDLKTINRQISVYRIYDLMVKNDWDTDWNDPNNLTALQTPLTKAEIEENDWWLRDANGAIVKESSRMWFLDIGKPGLKEKFLSVMLERMAAKKFDGVTLDYWWPSLDWLFNKHDYSFPPQGYADNDDWLTRAWQPYINYVVDGLHAAGYKVIGNYVGEYNTTNLKSQWQRSKVDGVIYEQWAVDWPEKDGETGALKPGKWLPPDVIEKRIASANSDPLEVYITDLVARDRSGIQSKKKRCSGNVLCGHSAKSIPAQL
jgi:hypothetical protein